ncbi:MAG: cytochrome c biogenesis protein CcdA [Chitinophagales bacterium]
MFRARNLVLFFLPILFANTVQAQLLQPVKWEISATETGINTYMLIYKATVEDGWKIYAKDMPTDVDVTPFPTAIVYDDLPKGFEFVGEVEELGRKEVKEEPLFDNAIIPYFHKKVTYRQTVKITQDVKLSGYIDFQTCDDRQCIAQTYDFSFDLKASTGAVEGDGSVDYSKVKNPVTWTFSTKKLNEEQYVLYFHANITPTWKLYSQNSPKGGARPMEFHFESEDSDSYALIDKVKEDGELETKSEPLFENKVLKYYHDHATMSQIISIHAPEVTISGYIEYQTCDATQCTFGTKDFTFTLSGGELKEAIRDTDSEQGMITPSIPSNFAVDTSYIRQGACNTETNATITDASDKNLFSTFILGFIGGLIGLLMPCTFPMIPFTISYFTKHAGNRRKGVMNASFYGISIILVYFVVSLPFLFFDVSGDALNDFSTNNVVNLVFFFVFILFALSLFGLFEIRLPGKWSSSTDKASDVGGLLGIFFMALTLCIVSFSCTGPILGSLLANSLKGGGAALSAGMVGFGTAFAIAFTLLALFPQLLNKLPKSGGWLNEVKVVFAFIELAFALKFLSNVDLAYHWNILKREIFLGIWSLIGLFAFLYVIGVIRFSHDTKKVKFTPPRIGFSVWFLFLTVYFASGIPKGRNLTLISGFTPPMFYSIWHYDSECPLALSCFHDFDEAREYAAKVDKPIMIDFTGWACVNCRKMEEHVWPDEQIYKMLSEDYVLVSLYVDDKTSLNLADQYISAYSGQKVRTIGNKWSDFQSKDFGTNSQPYYVLISPDGKVLNQPRAYTPDKAEYEGFLRCGLESYENLKQTASN